MPADERAFLDEDLALHEFLQTQIKDMEKRITASNNDNPNARRLQTLPGLGVTLANTKKANPDNIIPL